MPVYFNSATKALIRQIWSKRFCTVLITGSMNDLVGLLNQSRLSALTFQLIDRYEKALM